MQENIQRKGDVNYVIKFYWNSLVFCEKITRKNEFFITFIKNKYLSFQSRRIIIKDFDLIHIFFF